ncbi:MAG: MGMT family protein [Clostridiales Family XIII bacterium]|jgi:methylated-DNA-protein-cysteine methyltransferase-like protein|nr:MGMT family protein [Clostridiales Family XIII bacterium]
MFFNMVYEIVGKIPYGQVVSYGQIARMLGRPRAAREVGRAMRFCPEDLPWQRVVMADGSITGGEWAIIRRARLEEEDVEFTLDGRVDMEKCRWDGTVVPEES